LTQEPFGEVIESSLSTVKIQAYDPTKALEFGQFARVLSGSMEVVAAAESSEMVPVDVIARIPKPLKLEREKLHEVYPDLSEKMRLTQSLYVLGYVEKTKNISHRLPPYAPMVHDLVTRTDPGFAKEFHLRSSVFRVDYMSRLIEDTSIGYPVDFVGALLTNVVSILEKTEREPFLLQVLDSYQKAVAPRISPKMISELVENLFLLCGDTFKDPSPTPTLLKMFANRLARLSKANVKTVMIGGNHDAPKSGRAAPPEPLVELDVPNVYFFSKPDFIDLECQSGQKVRVFALPYRHPVKLASDRKKGKTKLDKDLLAQTFREQIAKEVDIFGRTEQKQDSANLVVGHLAVEGAVAGSEKMWSTGEEYAVLPSVFDTGAFDYIALGHIHKHQALKYKIPIVYPGSPDRVDIGEATEKKGFVDVKIDNHKTDWKFVETSTRPMFNLRIDCSELPDPTTAVKEKLEGKSPKDAIVELHLIVKEQLTQTQRDQINNLLEGAFWRAVAVERLPTDRRTTKGAFGTTLQPTEALGKYLNALKITEDQRRLAMKFGQEIINETLGAE
jgi:exonuclease SbcD